MRSGVQWIILGIALVLGTAALGAGWAQAEESSAGRERAAILHADFSALLKSYVYDGSVDYRAWLDHEADRRALSDYLAELCALDPESWPRADALAYWINLYNASALDLILEHYPIASIQEIEGAFDDPRVEVAGRRLGLDAIEEEIRRRSSRDARVHFAVNCAATGCPVLRDEAYLGDRLDEQLEDSTLRALRQDNQLQQEADTLRLNRIFKWYAGDFEADAGSVPDFLARYLEGLRSGDYTIEAMDYDWSLNDTSADGAWLDEHEPSTTPTDSSAAQDTQGNR